MDWGSISTLVAEVLFGGGLLVFVTIKDKKTAAILENMQTVIAEQKELAKSYKEEARRKGSENVLEKNRAIEEKYNANVNLITNVGSVIGAHSGPGTIALFFVGKER